MEGRQGNPYSNMRILSSWPNGRKVPIRLSRGNPVLVERCVCFDFIFMLVGILIGSLPAQVEVEVHRNVFGPENSERMTSRFVGRDTEVRSAVGDYLRWLKEDAQKRAEGVIKSAEVEIKRHFSPNMQTRTLDPQQVAEEAHPSTSEPVEEEDWASDASDTRASRPTKTKSLSGKAVLPFRRKGSVKAKKYVRPSTASTPNQSREPSQVRGNRSPTPSPPRYGKYGTGIPVSRTASWDVGSPYYHPRSSSIHTDSRRGSVRNLRIESLRTAGMPGTPRELSPARSVRFVDSPPPRTPLPVHDTSAPGPSQLGHGGSGGGSGDKEDDSPRNGKVAFELPSAKH
jgi:hypothetical protein